MKRQLLLIAFLIFSCTFFAQETGRVKIFGKIAAPAGEDLEGISVYNISSQKGTITDREGIFYIDAAVNDRILFTAIQFQKFTVIVDEDIINAKEMTVYVNPSVTELDEIVVRPYNLSGNIVVDAEKIDYTNVDIGLNNSIQKYNLAPDKQTSLKGNPSLDALNQPPGGANILGLLSIIGSVFSKKKEQKLSENQKPETPEIKITELEQHFGKTYFTETLKIPEDRIGEFLYFVEDDEFKAELLRENNELKLMDFLFKKSEKFRNLAEE